MTVIMSKISNQDKLDTINFFFEKQGKTLSSKSLTGKVMDQIIRKYKIDSYIYEQMTAWRDEINKKKDEERRINKEFEEKEKQKFDNLPTTLKDLCKKKYEVEEYMWRLKCERINLLENKKTVERMLSRGGKPESCYINEDGHASINGVIVRNHMGSYHREIYMTDYIRDLIRSIINNQA